ncbi:MAG: hypothetical protein ACI8PB_004377 [Desulforhopalus sp.]|jgi:hypothetical protein
MRVEESGLKNYTVLIVKASIPENRLKGRLNETPNLTINAEWERKSVENTQSLLII